jgi:hypothetical protein
MNWNPGEMNYGEIQGEYDTGVDGYVGAADIVGLARRSGVTPAQALAAVRAGAMAIPGLRPGQRVGQSTPDVARTQISPLPVMNLPAGIGSSATFTWQPQRPFRLERLFLQSVVSPTNQDFVITNLVVGADPQFVNEGPVPGSMFLQNAVGCHLRGNTANPGVTLSITVQNLTAGAISIFGGIIGTSLTS